MATEGGQSRVHPLVWAVAGAAVCALILWGASKLDEVARPTKSAAPPSAGEKTDLFVVDVKEEERGTVVIECDEGVQGDANARFRDFLGIKDPPLSIPGGPCLLARLPEEWSDDQGPAARSAVELLKRVAPSRVVLLSHSSCTIYDVAGAWQAKEAMVPVSQAADVAKAAKHIRSWLPTAKIEAYFARRDGSQIRFNAVPLPAEPEVR